MTYENPQGRRANALATDGPSIRGPDAVPFERTLTADPELDRIEPAFQPVERREVPTRSFAAKADLRKAVGEGFGTGRRRLRANGDDERRLAA